MDYCLCRHSHSHSHMLAKALKCGIFLRTRTHIHAQTHTHTHTFATLYISCHLFSSVRDLHWWCEVVVAACVFFLIRYIVHDTLWRSRHTSLMTYIRLPDIKSDSSFWNTISLLKSLIVRWSKWVLCGWVASYMFVSVLNKLRWWCWRETKEEKKPLNSILWLWELYLA